MSERLWSSSRARRVRRFVFDCRRLTRARCVRGRVRMTTTERDVADGERDGDDGVIAATATATAAAAAIERGERVRCRERGVREHGCARQRSGICV